MFFSCLKWVIGCLLLLNASVVSAFNYSVSVSESTIQEHLSTVKPLEKHTRFYRVSMSDLQVNLIKGSERVHFSAKILVSLFGAIQSQGIVKVSGAIEYSSETGQFFLIQPQVEAIDITDLPSSSIEKIRSVLQQVVSKALTKVKVYQLQDQSVRQKMLKSVLQSVAVSKDAQLLITLKAF